LTKKFDDHEGSFVFSDQEKIEYQNDDDSNHKTISDILKGTGPLKGRSSIASNQEIPLDYKTYDRKSYIS
jgi:hypothetical protein